MKRGVYCPQDPFHDCYIGCALLRVNQESSFLGSTVSASEIVTMSNGR